MMSEQLAEGRWCEMVVPKGWINCQAVKWFPEEGLLCERILKGGVTDARGSWTGLNAHDSLSQRW